ncbi:xanthine dehydrogenase family protein molybdopterin-binding subunit [Salmonirosea aquatica]|uniref:Molybdopterin-dependent oxidoreductase n=1 Tax=Salmonirosea aquatica TaxID=2654236 RepID=A0A7C9FY47_9BACT|nr:molybdopterin-dependent oxidoreductase [Cytophagaceae bacterium SJW1-29]
MKQTGQPISRLEGTLKVTGAARYAGEFKHEGMLYGYVVNSTIAKGKVIRIDTESAKRIPGVIEIFTHENRPSLAWFDMQYSDMDAPPGSPFRPLYDAQVSYYDQPIALVVAETFETARYAASILHVKYEEEAFHTDLKTNIGKARDPQLGMATLLKPLPPKPKGDFDQAFEEADAQISSAYWHGTEHHNPMEMHATTTFYEEGGKLTIFDKTQGTVNSMLYVCNVFGLSFGDVRVVAPYVGGAFGSGLRPQYQLFMSVMAATQLKRSVRVTLDREQMFSFGHRPPTLQRVRLGATPDGTVTALNHAALAETSQYEDYTEVVVNWSHILYPAKNTQLDYQLVPLDIHTPLDMRAPGGSTGVFAIESAMDELSYQLNMDPLELRLVNYSERDVAQDKPFSSKELRECYRQGAEKFGWSARNPEPRSMKRGHKLVGYGMATGIWECMTVPSRAEAVLSASGRIEVNSAVTDIGTGTLTVMTQIAADEFGLSTDDITFSYGDSDLPLAPIQGGSFTVSSVGSAVVKACQSLRKKLLKRAARMENFSLSQANQASIRFEKDRIVLSDDPAISVSYADLIADHNGKAIKTTKTSIPNAFKLKKYTRAAHSAAFVEVEVDEELGIVNVTRAITAVAAGKIVNPKTARSQLIGSMVWGISKALREETISDSRFGKYLNRNLAEYHLPVHADIHELDAIFVDEDDTIVNPLGSKGIGEIGIVAMAPAIANAIFHATGKRINHLPIHVEDLL